MKVNLIENFLSWQGEGPSAGKLMLILRFKTCSRKVPCYFCDTQVKMKALQEAEYTLNQIQATVSRTKCGIMVTGGEPTFEENYRQTYTLLTRLKYPLANVETNGYNLVKLAGEVSRRNVQFVWSPKIFSDEELIWSLALVEKIVEDNRIFIKLVAPTLKKYEISFLDSVLNKKEIDIRDRIYLMPEGKTREEIIKNAPHVLELCQSYSVNFSSRNHLIFGFV